jgi:hypothetical protein
MADLITAAEITAGATIGGAIGAFVVGAITNYTNTRINKEIIKAKRSLAHYERTAPFAEELLAAFLEFEMLMDNIRYTSPQGEHEGRVIQADETPEQASLLNTYYIPIKKIKESSPFISSFESKRYRAIALFGDEIGKSFELAREVIAQVIVAANELSRMAKRGGDEDDERCQKLHGDIWSSGDEDDKLKKKVSEAVEIVTRICGPILSQKVP